MTFSIYCDGSCRGNGNANAVGAYGYIILNDKMEIISKQCNVVKNTTNQRMELMALIAACDDVKTKLVTPFDSVKVYTDSAYCINCYTARWYDNWKANGWVNAKRQSVANRDLWELATLYFEMPEYTFNKVKGHVGQTWHEQWNAKVDAMVQAATAQAK